MALLRPHTVAEALAAARDVNPRVIAGGTDYFPALRPGAIPNQIMDVTRIAELRGIAATAQGWRFGATTTWSDVLAADLPPAFAALQAAAKQVGSIQIQNTGTIAGNLCNASPAADGVPPLMALGAEVDIGSAAGRRRMPLDAFITGPRQTALRPGELVLAVHVPQRGASERSAFVKLGSRAYLVISIAMVAVNVVMDAGRIAGVRIVVGACAPVACRLPAFEAALIGQSPQDVAQMQIDPATHLAPLSPIDDVRASADYRRHVAGVLCKRAVLQACTERCDA